MATITVTSNLDTTADDGVTTLREAIIEANSIAGADVIVFDQTAFVQDTTIRLTQGQISISGAVEIDGASADGWITITGDRNGDDSLVPGTAITDIRETNEAQLDDNSRVFLVEGGYDENGVFQDSNSTIINSLTITGGNAGDGSGGGIQSGTGSYRDRLIVENSIIRGNTASSEGGGVKAAYLTVKDSVVFGNSTTGDYGDGGGVQAFGILVSGSQISDNATFGRSAGGGGVSGYFVSITDSTITGNVTYGDNSRGGGASGATVGVSGSTITGNSTRGENSFAGGVTVSNSTLDRSIVLGNYSAQTDFDDVYGNNAYVNFSIVGEGEAGDISVGFIGEGISQPGAAGIIIADAKDVFAQTEANGPVRSGVLSDEGGLTLTVALLEDADNPALDAAPTRGGDVEDQTGDLRFVDLPGVDNGGVRDLGAREQQEFLGEGTPLPLNQTGGEAADVIVGTNAANILRGLHGRDFLAGRDSNDTLSGGAGADQLLGNDGNDLLRGGFGRDTLDGGDGEDTLSGGRQMDFLRGDRGDDQIFGKKGRDFLEGGLGNDLLRGGQGHDQLSGDQGADELMGANGRDALFGGDGHDLLAGGRGNDSLVGGLGDDTMQGGLGRDTFEFFGRQQTDLITDFTNGVDRIEFRGETTSFGDLQFSQDGTTAVIVAGEIEIQLQDFDFADLEQSDFIF